ncbi:hypothetical protein V8G54_027271 [Vigna mungo]|uniref:Uncharacterized protein n=1 Tax=Vigna mungo TaxID=3915 RepID=A0AAQ3RNX8_VIGMU
MCQLRDCSACECPESEFPESFKKPHGFSMNDLVCQEGKPHAAVDRTLVSKVFGGWIEIDNPWTNDDETDNDEMTYVNLQLNPERYTGYTGSSARRIWDAVLGLGTALKILFSVDGQDNSSQTLQLQRNEVIALMNLLNRLSESVKFVHEVGPAADGVMEGHVSAHKTLIKAWKKIWSFVSKT